MVEKIHCNPKHVFGLGTSWNEMVLYISQIFRMGLSHFMFDRGDRALLISCLVKGLGWWTDAKVSTVNREWWAPCVIHTCISSSSSYGSTRGQRSSCLIRLLPDPPRPSYAALPYHSHLCRTTSLEPPHPGRFILQEPCNVSPHPRPCVPRNGNEWQCDANKDGCLCPFNFLG